jgi:hypothetical protein
MSWQKSSICAVAGARSEAAVDPRHASKSTAETFFNPKNVFLKIRLGMSLSLACQAAEAGITSPQITTF